MKKIFLILVTICLLGNYVTLSAQESPVKWEFKTVKINDSIAELHFIADIKDNWHLYSQSHNNGIEIPVSFDFTASPDYARLGYVAEPKPIAHYDPTFGDTSLYFVKHVTFRQAIKVKNKVPFVVKGRVSGQACIDGRCVAIDTKFSFEVSGFENITTSINDSAYNTTLDSNSTLPSTSNQQEVVDNESKEEEESLLSFFLIAFLGGLAGLLMPCVFPMIPMTVSYFMKSGNKAKIHATIYGISIVVIYVLIGIVLSLIFGPDFANIVSTHWIPNILFALIFIFFAISLFGYFEISLPSSWINKSSNMESSGGVIGIFFMALTLVLVSFSCTLPIAGAVALGSVGGSLFKPIIGMLGFSLGIAIPFTLFAYFPKMLKNMPKSGGWMNTLKVVLAFVELAFALKFLNVPDQTYHWGLLDREVYLAFWIVIFSMMGFYLLGKIKFPMDDDMPYQRSWFRYILAIFTFTFVVYMIPGMFGAPLKAISGWLPPMTTQDFDINQIVRTESASTTANIDEIPLYADKLHLPHGVKGYFDYDQALRVAKEQNKPLFIDFTGHGCVNCRNVENAVWIDKQVRDMFAQNFVVVALYVDDKKIPLSPDEKLVDQDGDPITTLGGKNMYIANNIYKENSQPSYYIVDTDGSVLAGPIHYELNVENYLKFLQSGIDSFKVKHAND